MFLRTTVTKGKNASSQDIVKRDTEYFLNTVLMSNIIPLTVSSVRMRFSDMKFLECKSTVNGIRTTNLIKVPKSVTIPIYPKNDRSKPPKAETIDIRDIIYIKASTDKGCVWINYYNHIGELVTNLADMTMDGFAEMLKNNC